MIPQFKEEVIMEIAREDSGNGRPVVTRIVRWNNGTPKIEKRAFWTNEDGELRAGKNMGFTREDFEILLEKKDDILAKLS